MPAQPDRDDESPAETAPLWPAQSPQGNRRRRKTSAASRKGRQRVAEHDPVARVVVDVTLAHLDRTFDYQVPERLDAAAVPGCRVRARFSGQLVDGFLIARVASTEHRGRLAFLERVVSSEPVLSAELAELCRAVADRYGGTLVDVLHLAIPPRHAAVENEPAGEPAAAPPRPVMGGWEHYPRATAFADAVYAGRPAHAVWQAVAGEDWPTRLAELAATTAAGGRGAVLVVPDYRDLARLHAACAAHVGAHAVAWLSADLGPAERYRRWLAVSRGTVSVVVGTRSAMFAPVANAGLFVVWDDGDDLHVDPHMPYPQVRDVLMLRAHAGAASLLVAGYARTAEAQLLLESEWAHPIVASRADRHARAPRVTPFGENVDLARDPAARSARLPAAAFEAARDALAAGLPVLAQVPRRGYVPALACARCRGQTRCRRCAGPLTLPGGVAVPQCAWCGVPEPGFRCPSCGSQQLRAVTVGAKRTAEELGRAFPTTPVRTSGARAVLHSVPGSPALVVCTPGAEPIAEGGYGTALLLDAWALLGRQELRATEETLRRWMAAAALVRPAADGGRVVVGAEAGIAPVQALVRWDPAWHAELELAGRQELGFPPAARMASVEGSPTAVAALLRDIELPDSAEVLGPVPVGRVDEDGRSDRERALLRAPRADGKALAAAIRTVNARRSANKEPDPVRTQLDPMELI